MINLKKYKKNRPFKLVIIVFFISLLTFFLLNKYVSSSFSKINYYLSYPYVFVKNTIDNFKDSKKLNVENKILKEQIEILKVKEEQNKSLLENINYLKYLLELKTIYSSYNIINSTVIERNKLYYFNTITIDKGINDNIKENMAVVNKNGLIGKIEKVYTDTSIVRLITTNDNNKISVKIKNDSNYIYGTIVSFENDLFIINDITNYQNVSINNEVYTTGLGVFPSDILIGKIEKIEENKYNTNKLIYVKSDVNFNEINYVSILGNDL